MNLFIDIGVSQSRGLIIDGNNPRSIYLEDYAIKNISGNIYKGRVENITNSLGCAFVNIGEEKDGMLHLDDCTSSIKKGDEILVQVIREPSGSKGARLTMNLSIPSRNSVLLVGSDEINISRKINNSNRRSELFKLGKSLTLNEEKLGIIFRTSCEGISDEEITKEFTYIKSVWDKIKKTWTYIKGESLLFEASSFLSYIKREYINSSINKIYVNRKESREEILGFIKEDNLNIEVSSIEECIERLNLLKESIKYATSRKFNTSSGANIIVDETEALTIIDVNSAALSSNKGHEESSLNVNLDAIEKISQILSFRSSSGIILIDFINMKEESSMEKVESEVIKSFNEYNIKAKVHGFTKLGILEISRAKKTKPLNDFLYLREEEKVESPLFSLKNLENDLLINLYKKTRSSFKVNVSDLIYNAMEKTSFINSMKNIYSIVVEPTLIKDFKGYYILENNESSFARLSIGKRNYIGKVDEFIEDETSLSLKIRKMK